MSFRATWSASIDEPYDPPQKGFFGLAKSRLVVRERAGWVVGSSSAARDVQGVTYAVHHYVAVLPDGETSVIFLDHDKVHLSYVMDKVVG